MIESSPFLTVTIPYLTAFLAGLFSGVHCIGMCGGLTGAMVYGIPEQQREGGRLWPFLLNFNFGRITTYTVLGLLIGLLGSQGGQFIEQYNGWMWMRVIAGTLMVVMGLYLAGWWMGLVQIEKLGGQLIWQRIQPLTKQLFPITTWRRALTFGLAWGLLPCGLVYTMLVWSLAAGGWWQGALFLFSFGAGTLPTLLTAGWITNAAGTTSMLQRWRKVAGMLVIIFGLWTIVSSLLGQINVGLGCLPATA